ncbi:hydrogenase maturation protease [Risungbinella massiliensis]|uniref:hydrogenase maturation protease n=1 Tax=Risungbinella massiliensis TaxID=1329796 RepID=UPI0005CBCFE0|nr:hydrogenase maturation protease [Risungbinella massiliensis]
MGKIIVLGIGNQLMMDDGIGIYLVEELARHNDQLNVHYLIGESDIDYCLNQIEGASFVIILDAVYSGQNFGEVSVFPLTDLHEYQTLDISPHNLHLFHVLYHKKETLKGYLIGVEPYEIRFHIGLSDILTAKWSIILLKVKKTIEELIAKEQVE